MSKDISGILKTWEFSADAGLVRRVVGDDGRVKVQRRIELGVIQMEEDGRPDGVRPHGFPSYYEYFEDAASRYQDALLPEEEFRLSTDDCVELQLEALQYYQRRLCFFELQDFEGAARDARRNLEVFAFVREYAEHEEDKAAMDQYRAFVIFHRSKAEVLGALERKEHGPALQYIDQGEEEIRAFYLEYGQLGEWENSEEMKQLSEWRKEIERIRPLSVREVLDRQLQEAVESEEYERAAELRDEIKKRAEEEQGGA